MELKCKMCGAQLKFSENQLITTCESCGTSQFLLDFINDKFPQYQEKLAEIQQSQEAFEKKYVKFVNDVEDADSFCMTSSDFMPIIAFFEEAGTYKESEHYLSLAKIHFSKRVSSFQDCLLAIKFLEEIQFETEGIKEQIKEGLEHQALYFRKKELALEGYTAIIDTNFFTSESLLNLLQTLSKSYQKDISSLDDLDRSLVISSRNDTIAALTEYGTSVLPDDVDKSILLDISSALSEIKKMGIFDTCELESAVNTQLKKILEREHFYEQKRVQKARKEKIRKTIIITSICTAIIIGLLFAVISSISKSKGYAADNIHIQVSSKTNDKYNENLADGYIGAGYYYTFKFDVQNASPNDIKYIEGNMDVINESGEILSTSEVYMSGKLKAKSTGSWDIQLNVSKGKNAREIWNTDFSKLKITFKIKTIYFSDGTNKSYGDTKNEIVHPISN